MKKESILDVRGSECIGTNNDHPVHKVDTYREQGVLKPAQRSIGTQAMSFTSLDLTLT